MNSRFDQKPKSGNQKDSNTSDCSPSVADLTITQLPHFSPSENQQFSNEEDKRNSDSENPSVVYVDDRIKVHFFSRLKQGILFIWNNLDEDCWSMLKIGFFAGIIFTILLVRFVLLPVSLHLIHKNDPGVFVDFCYSFMADQASKMEVSP